MKKLLSVVISMCLLFSALSFPTAVTAETVTPEQETTLVTESTEVTLQENSEEITESEEPCADSIYAKTVDNGDGTKTLTLYDHPVRFVDENGQLQDISLEIAAEADGTYKTLAAESQTVFPKNISDGITLSGNGVSLKMTPATANTAGSLSSRLTANAETQKLSASVTKLDPKTVSYTYDSKTTLEYQLTYTGFKEDIVVSEYTGQTEYRFLLETGGLTLTKIDGSYYLTDENGEIKATIGDIIIFTADERNNTLGSMSHIVVRENRQYIITIHVDAEYLSDENTKYPLRIDPTIEITYNNNGAGAIQDVTICSNGSYGGTSGSLYIGNRSDKGLCRALIKFPGLNFSSLGNIDVQSAYVEIRDLMCESTRLGLEARTFMGNTWSESTSTTWANVDPESSADLYSYNYITYATGNSLSPKHRYSFEITAAVRGWHSGFYSQDKGIIIQAIEEGNLYYGETYNYRTFASYNRASNKPSFVLNYVDYNNLEDPFGYLEQVTSTKIKGWVYRSDIENIPIYAKAVLTNTTLGDVYETEQILANIYRADLENAGYGDGRHGFEIIIDWDDYSPGVYQVNAYGKNQAGNWILLIDSPKTYTNHGVYRDPSQQYYMMKDGTQQLFATFDMNSITVNYSFSINGILNVVNNVINTYKVGDVTITASFTDPNTNIVRTNQIDIAVRDYVGLSDGTAYYIMNKSSGRFLALAGTGDADYQNIVTISRTTSTQAQWRLDIQGSKKSTLASVLSSTGKTMGCDVTNVLLSPSSETGAYEFAVFRSNNDAYQGLYCIRYGPYFVSEDSNHNVYLTTTATAASFWSFMNPREQAYFTGTVTTTVNGQPSHFDSDSDVSLYESALETYGYDFISETNPEASSVHSYLNSSTFLIAFVHGRPGSIVFNNLDGTEKGAIVVSDSVYGSIPTHYYISASGERGFIENALSNLNCVLYIACNSGVDCTDLNGNTCNMVEETFDKGAHFVLGFEDTIREAYGKAFLEEFFSLDTSYYNLQQAIEMAKQIVENTSFRHISTDSDGSSIEFIEMGYCPIRYIGDGTQYLYFN